MENAIKPGSEETVDSDAEAKARAKAIADAYQEAMSGDKNYVNKVNEALSAQYQEQITRIYTQRRKAEFEAAKEALQQQRVSSGLPPGYKFSFSGADAQAWAYFPHKTRAIISEMQQVRLQLEAAESQQRAAAAGIEENPLNVDAQINEAGSSAEVTSLKTHLDSLENLYDSQGVVPLDSLTTVSINIHQPRSMVRALGFKGIKGTAGGVRTIAGTMIFTIVEHHPLRDLLIMDDEIGSRPGHRNPWSIDDKLSGRGTALNRDDKFSKVSTMLSPFNLRIDYVSEYNYSGSGSSLAGGSSIAASRLEVEGIRLISQGIVTSVNDLVTEVQYQFVAEDIKDFASGLYMKAVGSSDADGDPQSGLEGESLTEMMNEANLSYEDLEQAARREGNYDAIADRAALEYIREATNYDDATLEEARSEQ